MNKKNVIHCSKAIIALAKKIAEKDANTSCPFLGYQPRLPKEVKKLRKF
ncbi:MAG: cyclic lactone autoinducer peptide [Lachnospiraceae bacterium]|nr:cyclic lactone autoinducer peptide [Lachnospiraceae bacterium]